MLRIRIITALLILPVTLAVVFLTPVWLFRLLMALLMLSACWEFRSLAGLSRWSGVALLALQVATILLLYLAWPFFSDLALPLLALGCAAWLLMFLRLRHYRPDSPTDVRYCCLGFLFAFVAVSFCCFALWWLRDLPRGQWLVFLLFLMIWAADVGAYFSGRFLGRRKLAPVISPKKTWEGVWGGMAVALAAVFLLAYPIAGLDISVGKLATLSLLPTLASVGGDLLISLHKRSVRLKDTGNLFPGHGGILDRYDSLLAGAPFYALLYLLLVP